MTWDALPDEATAPILICVATGDDALNLSKNVIELSPTMGYLAIFQTDIFVYLHPKALPAADYVAKRERLLARIMDWVVFGVFNRRKADGTQGLQIPLASNVFVSAPGSDLLDGAIVSAEADWFGRGYGGDQRVRGAHFVHQGFVGG